MVLYVPAVVNVNGRRRWYRPAHGQERLGLMPVGNVPSQRETDRRVAEERARIVATGRAMSHATRIRCAYCRAAGYCECSELFPGQRVIVRGFSRAADGGPRMGTFIGYGADSWACGPNHVSSPGMRIVRVSVDAGPGWRGGETYVWEDRVTWDDGRPAYVRPAELQATYRDGLTSPMVSA